MNAMLILLALHAATPDARAFAACEKAARKLDACHQGWGEIIFVNGGYSTRLGFDSPRAYGHGGAVCQTGETEPCEWAPAIVERRPKNWGVERTALAGDYRYCVTERETANHPTIGCLTRARNLFFRHVDWEKEVR